MLDEVGVGHAADDLDDTSGGVDAAVIVFEPRAGFADERQGAVLGDFVLQNVVSTLQALILRGHDAAGVVEQFLDCQEMGRGVEFRRILFVGYLLAFELREVFFDRVVDAQLSFVDEHHDGRAGEGLADGG